MDLKKQPQRHLGRLRSGPVFQPPLLASAALLQFLHDLVQVEAGRLLPWRKLLERSEKLRDVVLSRDQQEDVIQQPVVVRVRRDVRPFVRIGPQIEDLRHAQRREGVRPDKQGAADPAKASITLAPEDYGTWLLANFASVAEVKANFNKVIIVPNPIKEIGGESFPGHFIVHDSTGTSVVIEPIDKTLKIYDNPIGAMSNSPAFDWHVTNLRNYANLTVTNAPPVAMAGIKLTQFGQGSGLHGIPGDFSPPSRFVRAVAYSQSAQKLPTAKETVLQVFHIMNAFDIPVGAVRDVHDDEVHYDYTVWTTVSDLKNIRWAFRTYNDQSIRSVDVRTALGAAGGEVKIIPMDSRQSISDVSTAFE